jgi:hypothetical protein
MAERDEKPIRVVDRRMFTPEGELRPDFQAEEEQPAAAPPLRPAEPPPPPPSDRPPAGTEPRTQFASFVEFLAINASSALQHGNPRVAQQMIDWLAMLEQKTRGNLSFEESNFLSGVLYELRLAFVEVSRPAPKK